MNRVLPEPIPLDERLQLTCLRDASTASRLAEDVRRGLTMVPKDLPPKYFYDAEGSILFDAICETPEYYPTRTEQALLERVAADVVAEAAPSVLVELGSGAARKTRVLLESLAHHTDRPLYMPVDIDRFILEQSARALLADYPTLEVHGVVTDYDVELVLPPTGGARLIAFLGSTLGNFDSPSAVRFLAELAATMAPADRLLLGLDLVKSPAVLHAAYNDAAGITAEFNRNVLRVLNRELDATFEVEAFEHVARYLPEQEQIEMHLRSTRDQRVDFRALDLGIHFSAGEEMRTEISRKFTRDGAERLLTAAGLAVERWQVSGDDYFALVTARVAAADR